MDFETFKENLVKDVKEMLDERTGGDTLVETRTVDKMNETYDAITVKPEDSIIGVNINATNLYKEFENGRSYDEIARGAADVAESALQNRPDFDLDSFTDYDRMKGSLAMEVVSKERNAELLETVPHKDIEDMSVVYRFVVGDSAAGTGTILVTNQMLENYGITAQQLHEDAVKNAPEVRPLVIEGMAEVLAKQMGVEDLEMLGLNIPPEQEQMFVASVEGNVHGAGVIAYEDFMDKASERVGGQEFIGLRWQDIDMEKRTIDINHSLVRVKRLRNDPDRRLGVSLPKTESGTRVIPMLDQVHDALQRVYEEQLVTGFNETEIEGMSGFIFKNANGSVLSEQNLNSAIKRIVAAYNMQEEVKAGKEKREPVLLPNFSVHYLRHTFCTRFCENESNVKVIQAVMGHKKFTTTMDVYAKATGTKKQEAMQKLSAKWKEF